MTATCRYLITPTPLGEMLVASTHRGLCRVALADVAAPLAEELRASAAETPERDETLRELAGQVRRCITDPHASRGIKLDIAGTSFQWRVWRALQAIPPGQTRSYSALAQSLGKPTACRAVAAACAANPLALVIPCHRAVGKRGEPRGYRWGPHRKRHLLQIEADTTGR